ncbi:MAG TPA: serine/threonine-protein kinase [Kofleriaceae bacterium]|nr:serine/threonine-protein kinase [Kofleriaceae bacterium]
MTKGEPPSGDEIGHADTLASDGASSGGGSPLQSPSPSEAPLSTSGSTVIRGVGPGDKLGRYELGDELGAGGMASVYRARDSELRRDVAVKVLFPHLAKKPDITRRFQREARAAAVLEHPNILRVYDVGASAGLPPYIVMELVRGQSLREVAEAHGPMLAELVACVGVLMCEALAVAHAAGIVHRDVKPGNVMLSDDGRLLLADFGVARLDDDDSLVTKSGALLGTPSFMAPEQALGNPVDARSDLYSVGASLYQLATGGLPFSGPTAKIVADASRGAAQPALRRRPSVGAEMSRFIERLMSPDPDKRPATAKAAAAELQALATAGGIGDPADEVKAFAADRKGWEQVHTTIVVEKLVERARAVRTRSLPQALALIDRALALLPEHAGAQELAAELQAPASRRWLVIAIGGPALALAATGAYMLTRGDDTPAADALALAAEDAAADATGDAVADAAAGAGAQVTEDSGPATESGTRGPDAGVASTRIRDAGARLAIDASPMRAPPIDAAAMLAPPVDASATPIDAAPAPALTPARITFAFDTWCELVVGDQPRGRADRELTITLEPGRHRARCSQGPGLETWTGTVDVKAGVDRRVQGTLLEPVDVLVDVGDGVRIGGKDTVKRGERTKLKPGRYRIEVLAGSKARSPVYLTIPRVEQCTLRDKPALDCYR